MVMNMEPRRPNSTKRRSRKTLEDDTQPATTRVRNRRAAASTSEQTFTLAEVRAHVQANPQDYWVVIGGGVYDVSSYAPLHPGGERALRLAAGQDVTSLFQTSHPFTNKPARILASHRIGSCPGGLVAYPKEQPIWDEIVKRTRKYLSTPGVADEKDIAYSLRVFATLITMFALGYYYGMVHGYVAGAMLLGLSRALFGLHTMHTACHFAFSHSPAVWQFTEWFAFDILMGGSSLQWVYQHVVGHHQHTNVFPYDPDLPCSVEGDMRHIVTARQKWHWMYRYQAWYLALLYPLLAFKIRVTQAMMMFGSLACGALTMTVSPADRTRLWVAQAIYYFYQVAVPIMYFDMSVTRCLAMFVVQDLVLGAYLAYAFEVNHISEDIMYTEDPGAQEWAVMQIASTVDYGHDSWWCFYLSGGLNFQVIHHLFPSVSPGHYRAIAPIVRKVCKEYGVEYNHKPTFWSALKSHFIELDTQGKRYAGKAL